jgi:hypothetical protein
MTTMDPVRIIEKDNFLRKDEQVELQSWFQDRPNLARNKRNRTRGVLAKE